MKKTTLLFLQRKATCAEEHPQQLEASVKLWQKKGNQPQPQRRQTRGTCHRRLQQLETERTPAFPPKTDLQAQVTDIQKLGVHQHTRRSVNPPLQCGNKKKQTDCSRNRHTHKSKPTQKEGSATKELEYLQAVQPRGGRPSILDGRSWTPTFSASPTSLENNLEPYASEIVTRKQTKICVLQLPPYNTRHATCMQTFQFRNTSLTPPFINIKFRCDVL